MRRLLIAVAILIALGVCIAVGVRSGRQLRVSAKLGDIEWVIVDCHDEGFRKQWVSKLTPETDARLITQLLAAIKGAEWKGATETGGDGFIVFKIKRGGIRAFNFVPWEPGKAVEIRPGFRSKSLSDLLEKIGDRKIGWNKGDSLPELRVKEIHVREHAKPDTVFRPASPMFSPLLERASQVLKAFDPRWCMPNYEEGNPTRASRYRRTPQFILLLEEPIPIYKLMVWWKEGGPVVSRVRYETFSSSLIAIYQEDLGGGRIAGLYIAFVPDDAPNRSYNWSFPDGHFAAKTIGKPDSAKAYERLRQVYEELSVGR